MATGNMRSPTSPARAMRESTISSTGTAATIWHRPAAHSCMGGKRFYYPADTEAFLRDEAAPVMDGGCGAEDYLILQLRLRKGLSLDEYKKRYGREFSTAQLAFVKTA